MRFIQTFATSFAAALLAAAPASGDTPCEKLAALKLPGATITAADAIAAGPYKTQAPANNMVQVPAFCRVAATLRPTDDSSIGIEVWLPENWNGKYEGVGGGGWAGEIGAAAMAGAIAEGYATSATDTGHKGNDASFAPGHPEKLIDFAYRGVHEMTIAAKALINAYYGRAPKWS